LNELLADLKSIGIKIIENSKYQNGYGEGICLILTQLLDKYLINQNFIFKKPNFNSKDQDEDEKDEIVDESQNVNINNNQQQSGEKLNGLNNNFYAKTGSYKPNLTGNKRFNSGKPNTTQGKKNFFFYHSHLKIFL
jgi:hypothetical protein